MTTQIKTLIIDGDETLWVCGKYYWDAMKQFAEVTAKRTGLDAAFCRSMLDTIDGGMTSLPGAFNRDRFPTAFRATSLALDAISHSPVNITAADFAWGLADNVFSAPYPLFPGVLTALTNLRRWGVTLILNTKGDQDVQARKVKINGLEGIFHKVHITLVKDTPYYEKILAENKLDVRTTACVGDSMRDDIIAPQRLGLTTILVNEKSPEEWKPKWSYEAKVDGPIDPTFWIKTFQDILTLDVNWGKKQFVEPTLTPAMSS